MADRCWMGVMLMVMQSLEAFVARLCLEDVDDLCAQFVTTKLT